jgi:hypothetical protein
MKHNKLTTKRLTVMLLISIVSLLVLGVMQVFAQAGEQTDGETAIYRGTSIAEKFDVSPALRDITPREVQVQDGFEIPERATGLEGPFGPQDSDPLVQGSAGPSLIPGPLVSFDGPTNIAGVYPPDPVGDVGPNHYVAMSNLYFAIYNKSGTLLYGPAANNTLWAGFGGDCETDNSGDPIVLYDQLDDRWILSQFTSSGPTYFNCVAVSTSGDPTSTYYRYAFSTGSNFPDYPKYGMWPDALYISTREFGPVTFAGVGAYAVNRAELIAGNPAATVISFLVPPGAMPYNVGDGLLPTDLDGSTLPPAGEPNFFVGSMDDGGPYGAPQDALTIWEFHADFAVPANSTFTLANTVPVAAFDSIYPCSPGSRDCIPQPGTAQKIDILSYRQRPMWRLAYRNFGTHESLVTNQSVEAAASLAGIRWYEIRDPDGTPTIYQQGTYAPGTTDGIHRWMGSIAMDQDGNMALGYSASDATSTFPSSWYTGRLVSDPLGTMPQGEASIINGTGSQTGSAGRWGDYTSMNVDPVDDCTFWYVNEYLPVTSATGWVLRIGAFKFPSCTGAGGPALALDKTVGTDPSVCAVTDMITLPYGGGDVTYCYSVMNTGTTTLTEHTLVDDQLGTILNNFPYSLSPGASVYITQTTAITQTTVNLATWTASDGIDTAMNSDTATVNVEPPEPIIAVDPAAVSSTQAPDAVITQTLTVSNIGTGDLSWSIDETPGPAAGLDGVVNGAPVPGGVPERLGPTAPTGEPAEPPAGPLTDVIMDGGFEAGIPNPFWAEASTNFGTPLCDVPSCGTGTGTGPHTGAYWAWFGGIGAYEEGSVSQSVTLSSGTATLSFYLEQIVCDSAADYLEVTVDGNQVFYTDGGSPLCGNLGYTLQTVDVSAYADGGTHTIEIHSEIFANNGGGTNFFVDDVVLDVVAGSCASPSDLPWVSVDPITGTTSAGGYTLVDVIFDSTGLSAGSTYTGTLCVNSNDATTPLVTVPLTLTVTTPSYGVDVSGDQALSGDVGTTITYTVMVTNTGNVADVYDLAVSGNSWTTSLSASAVVVNPGASAAVMVYVDVPGGASYPDMDTATFTATSQGDGGVSDSADLSSTAVWPYYLYLPVVRKNS